MTDTIYALATAPGRAAVAVVRMSGPGSDAAIVALTKRPAPTPRMAVLRKLFDPFSGDPLDEAIVLRFPGPGSFTGEDVAELHLHGGMAVIAGVMDALDRLGLKIAAPGQFTRRAFEHGRLTLSEAEAVADLIDAESTAQRRQAINQLGGALDSRFSAWREALISSLALIEAAIDFPDEDLPEAVAAGALSILEGLKFDLSRAEGDARGQHIRLGYRIALVGAPNAGKSSLFNALIGRDAAIVTRIAGTTRDVIEAPMTLGGYQVVLADTAGLHEAQDPIEIEGMRRARNWAATAALRIHVVDLSRRDTDPPDNEGPLLGAEDWTVGTKLDLLGREGTLFEVDTSDEAAVARLRTALADHVATALSGSDFPSATRERHRELIGEAIACLDRAIAAFGSSPELVGEDIRLAARALERLSGQINAETVLERVFSTFCIGK